MNENLTPVQTVTLDDPTTTLIFVTDGDRVFADTDNMLAQFRLAVLSRAAILLSTGSLVHEAQAQGMVDIVDLMGEVFEQARKDCIIDTFSIPDDLS